MNLELLIAEQLALHAMSHGARFSGHNACTAAVNVLLTSGWRESFGGPNLTLCLQKVNASLEANGPISAVAVLC